MRFFLSLAKAEENDDGTLTVSGIASTEATDAVGETITAEAIKAALPDFFRHGTGPLREMHQLSAAGTVDTAEIDDGNRTVISATVVDPTAALKVRTNVYKGFSVGGKVLARDPNDRKVITKIRLSEISLVDRPCNPEAVFDVWKADGAEDDSMKPQPGAETPPEPADAPATTAAEAPPVAPAAEPKAGSGAEPASEPAQAAASETSPTVPAGGPAPTPEPEAEKAEPADPLARASAALDALEAAIGKAERCDVLAKGLYSVSRFADVLQSIAYLVSSCASEAEYEGDDSPVPAKLRTWLVAGAGLFKEMAAEEIDELVAEVTAQKAATSAALGKADDAEALAQANAQTVDLLSKLAERDDALSKLAGRVEPLAASVESLTKRLAAVEAQPVPARTAGPLAKSEIVPVSKEQDVRGTSAAAPAAALSEDDVRKALDAMSDDERALLLTKAALARPITIQR